MLVDYKGGSAFEACARLPHTVGLVTDLDAHLTARALTSLRAEIGRRERLFRRLGAADLEAFQRLADEGTAPTLARIIIVVDEFRVLAEELPDFVSGLVRLAAVGRSLGVHLVLATQRPAGVVSADIKANVNLRIALRVRDTLDSTDVVESDLAATIRERTPGRAVVRSGSNPLVEMQTAHLGEHRDDGAADAVTVRFTSFATIGEAPPGPGPGSGTRSGTGSGTGSGSDLERIVNAVRGAAKRLAISPVPSPWLPPLRELVTLDELPTLPTPASAVPFGLADVPALQVQEVEAWDLARDGCLAVVGTGRSGRTGVVRTIVASAAERFSPADIGVYVLDGGGGLGALVDLPQVGAVVPRDDTERTMRLLQFLTQEVADRQRVLAAGGHAGLAEQRVAEGGADALPWLVLAVDAWDALRAAHDDLEGPGMDLVLRLAREGPGVGLLVLATGDRSLLMGAAGAAIAGRLVLRTADPTDALLAGVPSGDLPARLPAGRGLRVGPNGVREVQVAALAGAGVDQLGALTRRAELARSAWSGQARGRYPRPVPPMPVGVFLRPRAGGGVEVVEHGHRPATPGATGREIASGLLPVGVGGGQVEPLAVDPRCDGQCVLVAGHPRSGRSTTLLTLAAGLAPGRPMLGVALRRSPLTEVVGRGAICFGPGDAVALRAAIDAARAAATPAAVVVDDAELTEGTPFETVLLEVLAESDTTGEMLLLSGSSPDLLARFAGLTVEARKRGTGILLGPVTALDGELFGIRVSRQAERRPGRGLLLRRGEVVPVQVAMTGPQWWRTSFPPVSPGRAGERLPPDAEPRP